MISRSDLADDTALERFILDRLGTHRVRPHPPSTRYDLRNGQSVLIETVGAIAGGAGQREELRRNLEPLAFGAAFKILDQLVEHVLRDNGASRGRLTFVAKKQLLASSRPNRLPSPLRIRPAIWDRLAALYPIMEEPRHALVHRRVAATADGLEIYDNARQLIDTITPSEAHAFAGASHATVELVIDRSVDSRRLAIVSGYLNELKPRHQLTLLSSGSDTGVVRQLVVHLEELADGRMRVDVDQLRQVVGREPTTLWDITFQAFTARREFRGQWERIPAGEAVLDFDPGLLPRWLAEQSWSA
jgi:hypothetical protein